MRFLMLVKHAENAAMSGAPPKEFMDEMAKLAGDEKFHSAEGSEELGPLRLGPRLPFALVRLRFARN